MRRFLRAGFTVVALASAAAFADGFVFLSHDKVSLEKLLPPPPAPCSDAQKRDLGQVLEVQRQRTPERVPRTVKFFERVHYPSDVEASRSAGTAIAAVLMQQPGFAAELGEARMELRDALKCAETIAQMQTPTRVCWWAFVL